MTELRVSKALKVLKVLQVHKAPLVMTVLKAQLAQD